MHSCKHAGHVRASRAWTELMTLQPPRRWRRSDRLDAVARSSTSQQRADVARSEIDPVARLCEGNV